MRALYTYPQQISPVCVWIGLDGTVIDTCIDKSRVSQVSSTISPPVDSNQRIYNPKRAIQNGRWTGICVNIFRDYLQLGLLGYAVPGTD